MVKIALWNAMLLIRTPVQEALTVLMVLHLVAALAGAVLLLAADVAARLVVAPAELPVGLLTALVGAPFFILLLRGSRDYAL